MKYLLALAATVGIYLAVAACGTNETTYQDGTVTQQTNVDHRTDINEVVIHLNDGRAVTCLVSETDRGGGIACDWAGAQ